MDNNAIPLTPLQKNALHEALDVPVEVPAFALTGEPNPHLRVFVVHFDGTKNDKDAVPKGDVPTLVAESYNTLKESEHLASRYYAGVGTRTTPIRGLMQAAFGFGAEKRAEQAYDDLVEQAAAWRREDPDCEVHVHVVGFSRGAGIGVHFMNLVHERGIGIVGPQREFPEQFRPGEVKTSAVLYDAVTTGNDHLKLYLPDSNVATVHITAGGEERRLFPLTSLRDASREEEISIVKNVFQGDPEIKRSPVAYKRLNEIELAGARHSDVGGSYAQGGIREISKYLARQFESSLGLPVTVRRPTFSEVENCFANDSRFVKIDNDLEARQEANRVAVVKDQSPWSGAVAIRCEMIDQAGEEAFFKRYTHDRLQEVETGDVYACRNGEHLCSDDLGREVGVTVRLADANSPKERVIDGLEFMGEDFRSFDAQGDRLTFNGSRLPREFSVSRIKEVLAESGQENVTIVASMERGTPIIDLGHRSTSYEFAKDWRNTQKENHLSVDPWPQGVRSLLMALNDPKPGISRDQISMRMFDAMSELSDMLMRKNYNYELNGGNKASMRVPGQEDVLSVKIRSESMGGQYGSFQIECVCRDGTVLNGISQGKSPRDYLLLQHMNDVKSAMECIAQKVSQLGIHVDHGVNQVFTREGAIDNELSVDLSQQKTLVLDQTPSYPNRFDRFIVPEDVSSPLRKAMESLGVKVGKEHGSSHDAGTRMAEVLGREIDKPGKRPGMWLH